MCGIAGVFHPRSAPRTAVVDAMLDLIAHRGPDGRGVVSDGPTVLGHVRLSILDLTDRAAQPMRSHDGRFLLTYNGEVYNFADLRSRLLADGVAIDSTGDTQALLEHLVRFGVDDTLARIEGFFAFALWDARDHVLTLARDRLGKKPLYWSCVGGAVRFASEMKALADATTRPDLTTLDAMLLGFSGTWGRATPFEGIESVEAGSIVQFRDSSIPSHRRWFTLEELVDPSLHAELDGANEADVLRWLADAFDRSLAFRMVSDVPVASLVSGGVDSSLVTVLASATDHPPELYHADVVADSERPAAESVAARVGRRLHVARVTDESFLSQVARATWFNDAPLTYHVNAVPFLSVCERAGGDGVKVLLSGEGSDEFFLGYPQYGLAPYLDAIGAGKGRIRSLARRAAPRVVDQLWPSAAESKNAMLRELVSRAEVPLLEQSSEGSVGHLSTKNERRAHVATLSLARSHLASLLHRNDRLGMAAGVENRFPFLGNDLTRLAVNLPARYKLRWVPRLHDRRHPFVVDKWLVRELAARRLPEALAMREKQGFPVRVQDRLRIRPSLFAGGFVSQHWRLSDAAVEEILDRSSPTWQLGLALVEIWGRQFFKGESCDEVAETFARHTELRSNGPSSADGLPLAAS
jgi:asparagine synthase (glutamine-hydrolysing)